MAANAGAADHVLPVVTQTEINQRLQQRTPNALVGPAPEPIARQDYVQNPRPLSQSGLPPYFILTGGQAFDYAR